MNPISQSTINLLAAQLMITEPERADLQFDQAITMIIYAISTVHEELIGEDELLVNTLMKPMITAFAMRIQGHRDHPVKPQVTTLDMIDLMTEVIGDLFD